MEVLVINTLYLSSSSSFPVLFITLYTMLSCDRVCEGRHAVFDSSSDDGYVSGVSSGYDDAESSDFSIDAGVNLNDELPSLGPLHHVGIVSAPIVRGTREVALPEPRRALRERGPMRQRADSTGSSGYYADTDDETNDSEEIDRVRGPVVGNFVLIAYSGHGPFHFDSSDEFDDSTSSWTASSDTSGSWFDSGYYSGSGSDTDSGSDSGSDSDSDSGSDSSTE